MSEAPSWVVTLDLGSKHYPHLVQVPVEPLPSGLAQAVIAVRVPKAVPRQRRFLRLFEKESPRRGSAGWREAKGYRDGRWWIAGPFPYTGETIARILRVLSPHPEMLTRHWQARKVFLVDPRTDQELPMPPTDPTPQAPTFESDEDETSDSEEAPESPPAPDPEARPADLPYVEGGPPPTPSARAKNIVAQMKGAERLSAHDRAEVEGFAEWLLQGGSKNGLG